MSSRFDRAYRVGGTTVFNAAFWNRVLRDLDTRILSVEEKKVAFEDAERTLLDLGLKRINETLMPVAEYIMRVGELGFLVASSDSTATMQPTDIVTLVVREGEQRTMLHPSPFIALTRRSTVEDYAIARTISYDNETGVLAFEVLGVTGNGGPHSDWDIAALAASVPASLMMLEEVRTLRQQVADDVGDFEGLKEAVEADREAVDQARTDVGNIRTEVEQARDDAQGHLDTFLQVYRGALSAPPAGGQIGHFYFDTTDQQARVYTESGWSPLFSVALGGIRQGHHVATNGQTEFVVDGGFTFLNVFKNGSLLEPGADYTHDSPTFTLTSGAAAGDVVAYLAYRQIDEVDFYTKADADARYLHVGQLDGGTY